MNEKLSAHIGRWLYGLAGILAWLIIWEIFSTRSGANRIFFSAPSKVALAALSMLVDSSFWQAFSISLLDFSIGLVVATAIGVPLGLLMGRYRRIDSAIDPIVSSFNVVPVVALWPLFVLWLGPGQLSILAVVFFCAVFPIILNGSLAIKTASQSRRNRVALILRGIRLAVYPALVGIIIGEMVAAPSGIGDSMIKAVSSFKMGNFLALFFVLMIFAVVLTKILEYSEHRLSLPTGDQPG